MDTIQTEIHKHIVLLHFNDGTFIFFGTPFLVLPIHSRIFAAFVW